MQASVIRSPRKNSIKRAKSREGMVTFVCGSESRRVDLRAPIAVSVRGRRAVNLMDLWVATQLPGDLPDLVFDLFGKGTRKDPKRLATVNALQCTRGYVALDSRELFWDEAADSNLNRMRAAVTTIVVRAVEARPAPPAAPSVVRVASAPREARSPFPIRLLREAETRDWRVNIRFLPRAIEQVNASNAELRCPG